MFYFTGASDSNIFGTSDLEVIWFTLSFWAEIHLNNLRKMDAFFIKVCRVEEFIFLLATFASVSHPL